MTFLRTLLIACSLSLASLAVNSAVLQVSGGQLTGATGVDVGGEFFDVEFVDGSCVALFSGCDEPGDFVFPSQPEASAAAAALLDQVFIGAYDSTSSLTAGCDSGVCKAMTPYAIGPAPDSFVSTWAALNFDDPAVDFAGGLSPRDFQDTSNPEFDRDDELVYAVWSPVPAPPSLVLISLGLAGMAIARIRRPRRGASQV